MKKSIIKIRAYKMSSHIITYLDINYLSNMAKANIGVMKSSEQLNFWQSLFADLKKGVLENKIACPELNFHETEAVFDSRIGKDAINILIDLSWELKFHHWNKILESQIEDAAKKYLNIKHKRIREWQLVFETDPHEPVQNRMQNIKSIENRKQGDLFHIKEFTERDREMKIEFVNQAKEKLKFYSKQQFNWKELLIHEKQGVIDGYMGKTAITSIMRNLNSDSFIEIKIGENNYYKLKDLFYRLNKIGINTNDTELYMGFLNSKELLNCPYVDIYASIWSEMIQNLLTGRKPSIGDNYDAAILAVVLPYCDIVTTDKYMKDILINKLEFNNKYQVQIFSSSKSDRVEFQNLIKNLTK